MIIRSDKGLCTPYSRIIFGLSVADIMQSIGIIISPLVAPSGTPDAPWAMGSTGSCSATGFVLHVGGMAVPFYTLFLTHYFLQRVKYKLTPAQFARKMECRISTFIWLFSVIGGLVGLVKGYFNPSPQGSLCMMIGKPLSCNSDPTNDCVRGEYANLASLFLVVLPFALSFAMVVINLARFTFHVYQQEQMFEPTNQEPISGREGEVGINGTSSAADVEIIIRDEVSRKVPYSLAKQSLVQSSLYIAAFFICYFAPIVIMIMSALGITRSAWLRWFVTIFWPMGGLFNILIYTRPKVSCYKDSNPEYSRLRVFLIIVLSGGEVPTEIDFGDNNNDAVAERERRLNSIRGNIIEYHANKDNEGAPMKVSDFDDSLPTRSAAARVKNQDSCDCKEVLAMNSFPENSLSYRRNDKEHSYGTEMAFPLPSVIGRQYFEDVSSLAENLSGTNSKEVHSSRNDSETLFDF